MEIISVNITKGGYGKTTTVQMLGDIIGKKNLMKSAHYLILSRVATRMKEHRNMSENIPLFYRIRFQNFPMIRLY